MANANWSKQIAVKDTPLDVCYKLGQTHKSYKWGKSPYGEWSDEQKRAYYKGYEGKYHNETRKKA